MQNLIKPVIALGILALCGFTMFRGQGWWWRFSKRSRVTFALFAVAFIIAGGYFYASR